MQGTPKPTNHPYPTTLAADNYLGETHPLEALTAIVGRIEAAIPTPGA